MSGDIKNGKASRRFSRKNALEPRILFDATLGIAHHVVEHLTSNDTSSASHVSHADTTHLHTHKEVQNEAQAVSTPVKSSGLTEFESFRKTDTARPFGQGPDKGTKDHGQDFFHIKDTQKTLGSDQLLLHHKSIVDHHMKSWEQGFWPTVIGPNMDHLGIDRDHSIIVDGSLVRDATLSHTPDSFHPHQFGISARAAMNDPSITVSATEGVSVSSVIMNAAEHGKNLTYSLSGTDASSFSVDSSGNIRFVSQPNYESKSQYVFTIDVYKNNVIRNTETVTVNLSDLPPVISSPLTGYVLDGSEKSTLVYNAYATDPGGSPVTYSLSGRDANAFSINSATGAITLNSVANLQTQPNYNFRVIATDVAGLSTTQAVTLNVTSTPISDQAMQEPLVTNTNKVITYDPTVAVPEGTSISSIILSADDKSPNVTYSLVGPDASSFTIDAQGNVRFIHVPSYESVNNYNFTIDAFQNNVLHSTEAVFINVTDLPPTIYSPNTISVQEGTATSTVVYTVQAVEPGGGSVTYSIAAGGDASAFSINPTTGAIVFNNAPNFENQSSYNIVVQAIETSGLASAQNVTINVVDVAPIFSSPTSATVQEGTPVTTAVYSAQAIEPGGGTISYSLSNSGDASAFSINASTGVVTFNAPPNYEAKSSYNITVQATETNGLTTVQDVNIHVTDVAPLFPSPSSTVSVPEGTATSTVVYTASAIEPGGGSITYSLQNSGDSSAFSINASTGAVTFNAVPNYEAKSSYNFVVQATEASGLSTTQAVTINVQDVAPIFSSPASATVAEGTATSTVVYSATAIEPGNASLTYSLVSGGDSSAFSINATTGAITFNAVPNYEAKNTYQFEVRATEASGLSSTKDVTINITNEPLTFSSPATITIPEGISTSTVIYTAQAIEPGGNAPTYSLAQSGDHSAFTINAATGTLTFNSVPNYEAKSSYNIVIQATEAGGTITTQAVTVNVSDSAPVLTSATAVTVAEGTSTSTIVYTASALEPGGGTITYSISGADASAFNINAATGAISFINSPNYEAKSNYHITVTATEASGLFTSQAVAIGITDVAPIFSSPTSISVPEGISTSTVVYTAAATEPGGAAVTYSLGGTDATAFSINAATGAVTFNATPNFEAKSSYSITVSATEASGLISSQAVAIGITDVAPVFSSPTSASVAEGTSTSTVVYTAAAIEPGGGTVTYALVNGGDSSAFSINATTGAITFNSSPNFEAKSSYQFEVKVTEASGLSATQAVTLTVTDVPPVLFGPPSVSVPEGISASTVIYTASALEPGGGAVTYSIGGTDAAAFNINAATGAITFIHSPNAEAKSTYNIDVIATEASGLFTSQTIAIGVTDVAPIFSSPTSISIPEGTSSSAIVYTATAIEPGGASVVYSLGGTDAADFNINAATGAISFIHSPNYEAKSSYNINVTATEVSNLATTQDVVINITDIAPTFSSPTAISVPEGTASSTIVYTATATEPGGGTLTYSLSGTDASAFNINAATGAISFIHSPNYEAKSSYNINVTATEASGLSSSQNVAIGITDVAPVFSSPTSISVPEGTPTSASVYTATAIEPGGGTVTYSLSGTDAAAFNINAATGSVTFINSPNYEAKSSYNITVVATEASGLFSSQAVAIGITDVAPVFSSPASVSVPEGTSTSAIVYTAHAIEPGGGPVTYSLSGTDAAAFNINAVTGVLTFKAAPNFEAKSSYNITVSATEASGLTSSQAVAIGITDVAPVFSSPTAISVPEGTPTSATVYTATAIEPGGGTVTYSLSGTDASSFNINSATGAVTFTHTPNYEAKSNYNITVTATENSGLSSSQAVAIGITDVAPTFSSPTAVSVPEGMSTSAIVYTAAATEPGGGTVTYSLSGSDAAAFNINAATGAVTFKAAPNFEVKSSYNVTVSATEASGASSSQAVAINIVDVAPVFSSPSSISVPEGISTSTIVYTASAIEPGGGNVTYSLSGTDAASFNINSATGAVTFKAAPNFEAKSSYNVTVSATETSGLTSSQAVAIGISDVAPTFSSPTAVSVPEGTPTSATVYTATAIEPGGGTVTYSLSGSDAAAFNINAATGSVTFKAVPNFEAKGNYNILVNATEASGLTSSQAVAIGITDVAPVFSSPTAVSVPEGTPTSATVYTATAIEPGGGTVTYSLSGSDAAAFNINAATGSVTFKAVSNFEAKSNYNILVNATEASGLSSSQAVAIGITDVAPVFSSPTAVSVPEGTPTSATVYTATAIEPGGGTVTYSLSGSDAAAFNINAATGSVTFKAVPNFEAKSNYNILVKATEASGLSSSQAVAIGITDVAPVFSSPTSATVPEGTPTSATVYTATAIEPGGGTITYSLSGSDAAAFNINAATGSVTFKAVPNYEAKNSYNIMVTATEASGLTASQAVTIGISDVAPLFSSPSTVSVPEGTSTSTTVYTATATEPGGGTLTYSLSGTDAVAFNINAATGAVTFKAVPNFEAKSNYNVMVTATEASGLSSSQAVAIGISDVAPVITSPTSVSVPEGTPSSATVYTVSAIEPGGGTITYSLSGADASAFNINTSSGAIAFINAPNYEAKSSYNITVTATEASGLSSSQSVNVGIADITPTFSSPTSITVPEGTSSSAIVYTAVAAEPGGGTVTYSLSGTDSASFNINSSNGTVTFINPPNYEAKSSYNIIVTATEGSSASSSQAVAINIADVAPILSSPTAVSVPEGSSTSAIVYTATAIEPGGGTVTYSLSGTDASSFNINSATGGVTFKAVPNFEAKSSYNIMVTATEASGLSSSQAVAIGITDVAPVFSSPTSISVPEGTPSTAIVYTATAIEPGGGTVTYSLSGSDAAAFNINAATGSVTFKAAPNYEAKSSYNVMVTATEASGLSSSQAVAIGITDVAPVFSSPTAVSVPEGTSTSAIVYTASAIEPGGGTVTYSLSGSDAAAFNINAATGSVTFKAAPNYEAKSSYNVTVTATETSGLTSTQNVAIGITDAAPVFSSPTSVAVPEGTSTAAVIYTATAIEPGGGTITYSLSGTDAASFNINAATGSVTFKAAPNYEAKSSYSIAVTATETSGLTSTQNVAIGITDVAPVFSSPTAVSVPEGTSTASVVYTATAIEPGGGTVTYSLSGTDAAAFNINAATGAVTFKAAPNYEAKSSYSIAVTATETSGLTSTQNVAIGITDVAPIFSSPTSISVPEGTSTATVVYTVAATEPGGGAITYSLSGTDAASFNINSATGQVTFKAAPNYEAKASYSITVTATEASNLASSQAVTIAITDVAPVFSSPTSVSVPEGTSTATVVYTAAAIEPGGGTVTYSLSGADAAAFNINAATGAVTFKAAPNYEVKTSYSIAVTATETSGLTSTQNVAIGITDVAPVFSSPTSVAVPEGTSTAAVVYTATAIEPGGGTVTYSLSGTDAAAFNINAATGAVTFKAVPNYEAKSSYNVMVTATEASGLSSSQAVAIGITDVAPVFSSPTTVSVPEGTSTAVVVYTATAIEPGGGIVTYSLSGTDAASFNINAATGAVTFKAAPNFEAKSSYNIAVTATETSGLTSTQNVAIGITDVAPIFSSPTSISVPEGTSTATVVYTVAATEPGGGAITYSLSGTDAASFNINSATGAVTFKAAPNYEAKTSYSITVTATEASNLSSSQAVTIAITDVAPIFSSPTSVSVPEGTSTSAVVYTATAIEPGGGAVTYSLSGTDAASFNINAATGSVTFKAVPNYEAKSSYSITVTATETSGLTSTQNVAIGITDIGPIFSSPTTVSVPEGTSTAAVVYTATAIEPGGGTVTYSLSGTDAAAFNINAATGSVTFKVAPNYEAKSSYSITVTATETSGLTSTQNVAIGITDVAPIFSSPTSISVPEGTSTTTVVYTAAATEPGGGTVTYSLSGTDAAAFNINAATGSVTFKVAPNYEAKSSYSITVTATEASNLSSSQAVTIGISDVAPIFSSPTSVSVPEGTSTAAVVYTAAAIEPGGGTVTYSLSGTDAAAFNINAATGAVTFKAAPNYEAKTSYSFTVSATEISGLTSTQNVAIAITDVAPVFSSPTSVSVPEGTSTATVVYTAAATEPGGGTLTYSLSGSDAASFNINSATGSVTFKSSPNFEAKTSYSITVTATEASNLASSQAVTIAITDVAPVFSSPTAVSVPEGTPISTIVYTASAIEPGGGTITYSLSGTDAASFNINAATGAVTFKSSPNFEAKTSYSITVTATEASNLASSQSVTIAITDVVPIFSSPTSVSVPEGTSTATVVYTAAATEPGGGTITYSLSGTDAASFNINSATGSVTFKAAPNYEAKSSYSITVTATEANNAASSQAVTIAITDVAPVFSSPTSVSVPEGTSTASVVYTATAIEPGGGTVTYSLSGTDAASFNINAATGAVTFKAVPNFEAKSSYNIAVTATETSGLTSTQNVAIGITDVAPVFSSPTSVSVPEGTSTAAIVYTAAATEPGGGTVTYSLSGTDAAAFNINAATGAVTFKAAPNYEAKTSYSIAVTATETSGLTSTQNVAIGITDVAPVFSSPTSVSVPEGTSTATVVYSAAATEPGGGTLTYSLSGTDAAAFNINAATGSVTFKAAPNFEAKSSYSVTVTATETSGLTSTQNVAIAITDVAPVFSSPTSVSVPEGTSTGAVVYTATAIEPGGGTVTYSLSGADAASFNINAATGAVTFKAAPNFEAKSSYSVTVTATETSGLTSTQNVAIAITDVAPVFSSPTSISVPEGTSTATVVYTVAATEPGGGAITYSLSGTDAASFNINSATGQVTFKAAPNYEAKASYSITVTATEASNLASSQAVSIAITDVAPIFSSPTSVTVPEGTSTSAVVYTATAIEPGGGTVTYSLSGTDAAAFNINAATGAVTFKAAPNYEAKTSYSITVTATETSGLTSTQNVAIGITDVAPIFSSPTSISVPEGTSTATVVYTVAATEPGGGAITYSLSGTDAASFNINSATGQVTFKAAPNYEAKTSYSITVTATEASNLASSQAVTIAITDVAPVFSSPTSVSVPEGTSTAAVVYTAAAIEPGGGTVTYSLSGTDAAAFNINATTGAVTFKAVPNYEAKTSYSITVTATETSGLTSTQNVAIGITDVAPIFSSPTSISVPEGTSTATVVYTVAATEPGGGAITYSLSGTDAASFNINSATGAVTFKAAPNYEAKTSYSITVTATEVSNLASSQAVTIAITDVAPVFSSPTTVSVPEGTPTATVVYTAAAIEPGGGTITYSLSGTDAAAFNINAATGAVTFKAVPNYEAKTSYSITVTATEASNLSSSQVVTIGITDVAPIFSSPTTVSVPEGTSTATVVYTAAATEPGGGTLTYSLSGTDAASFNINSATGVVTFKAVPNYEVKTSYSITVTATEASTLASSQAVTIAITDVAPVFSSPTSISVPEGTSTATVVYTVAAAEPGGGTLTYSLSGTDAASFNINSATGAVTFKAVPNYEAKSSYSITVTATEASNLVSSQAVTIAIADVAPVFSSPTSVSVPEGTPISTIVYTASAIEPGGGTITYSLSGTDAASFNINSATGAVTFKAVPNVEAKSSYSITVTATEASALASSQVVAITITDVVPIFSSPTSISVPEGTATSTVFYTAAATEPGGGTLTYSLSGTDAASFNINAATGAITFKAVPNFEVKTSYSISVTATEASGPSSTQAVSISVTDIAPYFISPTTISVPTGTTTSTIFYTAVASEPGGGTLTYSLGGTDAASFNINASNGEITFKAKPNFGVKSSYSVTISAKESSGLTTTESLAITITSTTPTTISVAEGRRLAL